MKNAKLRDEIHNKNIPHKRYFYNTAICAKIRITMLAKVFIYRIVDICDELDVNQLKAQLKRLKIKPLGRRYFAPVYLNFATPPVEMKTRRWFLKEFGLQVETIIKFYSLGLATLRYEISIEAPNYFACFKKAKEIINNPIFDKRTKTLLDYIKVLLERELKISIRSRFIEDYSVLWLKEKFSPQQVWLKKLLAQFLRDETFPLSKSEEREALRYQFSYTPDDLTVIDWDRAVTVDTLPQEDVWDVLEYANLQLTELRYYENYLDKQLDESYKFTRQPYRRALFGLYQMSGIIRRLSNLYLDFSEEERRLNSFLRLTGDEYLSRIYSAAVKRLNVDSFQKNLKDRLADTRRLYEMLSSQASSMRMEILEVAIVVLFILSVILEILK